MTLCAVLVVAKEGGKARQPEPWVDVGGRLVKAIRGSGLRQGWCRDGWGLGMWQGVILGCMLDVGTWSIDDDDHPIIMCPIFGQCVIVV